MQANDLRFNELGNVTGIGRLLPGVEIKRDAKEAATARAGAPAVPRAPYARFDPRLTTPAGQALLKCGLWLRAAIVGASMVIAGIAILGEGGGQALFGVLSIALGVPLAVFAVRRARAVLDHADQATDADRADKAIDATGAA
jgi:hypothetical protein